MIVCTIGLENLVHTFEKERPEFSQGSIPPYEVGGMGGVVMIWPNDGWAI